MDGAYILRIRKAGRWTQQQFANLLEVTPLTISRWERGKSKPLPAFQTRLQQLERHASAKHQEDD